MSSTALHGISHIEVIHIAGSPQIIFVTNLGLGYEQPWMQYQQRLLKCTIRIGDFLNMYL
jgi:hypothetical protein